MNKLGLVQLQGTEVILRALRRAESVRWVVGSLVEAEVGCFRSFGEFGYLSSRGDASRDVHVCMYLYVCL